MQWHLTTTEHNRHKKKDVAVTLPGISYKYISYKSPEVSIMLSSLKYFACQHSLVSQCRTSLHYKDPLPRLFNSTVASVSEHENIMHIWPIMMHAVSCKHHENCVHKMHKPWFGEQFATTVTLMS